jgi:hypothetical protein
MGKILTCKKCGSSCIDKSLLAFIVKSIEKDGTHTVGESRCILCGEIIAQRKKNG